MYVGSKRPGEDSPFSFKSHLAYYRNTEPQFKPKEDDALGSRLTLASSAAKALCLVSLLVLATVVDVRCVMAGEFIVQGNPTIVGVWWDTTDGSDWTVQQLADDVHQIKLMNFTAIYCVEKSILDGTKDNDLNDTWSARIVDLAEDEGLRIVWAVWETDNPPQWINKDLNNQTFRQWFANHLTKWQAFITQHPCIIQIVFDDFGPESQFLNMTEFTQFVRQYIPLPTMIEYDDRYDSLNPQYCVATVTEGYLYYYQDSRSWTGFWIDYVYQHYGGAYPFHTLGISLEAFDGGMGSWTPAKHRILIDEALDYNFTHYEYWAWRWSTPESPAIAAHPEYWSGIKQNNEHILQYAYTNTTTTHTTGTTLPDLSAAIIVLFLVFATLPVMLVYIVFKRRHPHLL
jgi:hypothetical protein